MGGGEWHWSISWVRRGEVCYIPLWKIAYRVSAPAAEYLVRELMTGVLASSTHSEVMMERITVTSKKNGTEKKLENPCWSGFEEFRIFFKTCATGAF